ELQKDNATAFARLRSEAQVALRDRRWSEAASKYEAAHAVGQDPESLKSGAFARCMAEAEAMFASKPTTFFNLPPLIQKYEQALQYGLDQEYVRARLDAVRPTSYRITINNAV